MSSSRLICGLPIIDIPEFKGRDQKYILRAKDENEIMQKFSELQLKVPESVDILVYPMGYKPDRPVPVARCFAKISFHDHSVGASEFDPLWAWAFHGLKKEGK